MRKIFIVFFLLVMGCMSSWTQTYTVNVMPNSPAWGEVRLAKISAFSVSATKKVRFSQGNLQYQKSTNTWRFAEHQYDYIGKADINNSHTYPGWIDLFYWSEYGYELAGNIANDWYVLSYDEWEYLLKNRPNANAKQGVACVNGVNGLVLLPDEWTLPDGAHFTSGCCVDSNCKYISKNTYTILEWEIMESAGAVFLPAAGCYNKSTLSYGGVGTYGKYWASNGYYINDYEYVAGYSMCFDSHSSGHMSYPGGSADARFNRGSIRLCSEL